MGLFTPVYLKSDLSSKQKEKAYAKINKLRDTEKIKKIVMEASDPNIAEAAFRRLDYKEQTLIARSAPDPKVRIAALGYLQFPDPDVLLPIAREDADQSVQETALTRLEKIIVSGKPTDSQSMKRFEKSLQNTFDAIGNQEFLARVGGSASCNLARYEAIRRLEDRSILSDIALRFLRVSPGDLVLLERISRTDATVPPYEAAMDRLIELDGRDTVPRLRDIILNSQDSSVRKTALEKLNGIFGDQTMPALADVARKSSDFDVRMVAVERLVEYGDEELLLRIAQTGILPKGENEFNFLQTLNKAVKGIRNQTRLESLAKTAPYPLVRSVAAERLENQKTLFEIARTDPDVQVRTSAASVLTDSDALAKIIQEERVSFVRQGAAGNTCFTDTYMLAQAARTDKDSDVRARAVMNRNLTDPKILEDAAIHDSSTMVRTYAVNRLNDTEALYNVAAADSRTKEDAVRWLAAVKLSRISPDRAIEPLVTLMQLDRETSFNNDILTGILIHLGGNHEPIQIENKTMKALRQEAADFLIRQYTRTNDPAVKALIRSLPDGVYGSNAKQDRWTEPGREDQRVHFKLPSAD